MDNHSILTRRLAQQPLRPLDIRSRLLHFAIITYAIPATRLVPHLPTDRFSIPEFEINGESWALISAVPFLDVDFQFPRFGGWPRWRFAQTNYRAYIIDRATGEHAVWFFGTTLGSPLVHIARQLWSLPWHPARYRLACHYNTARARYDQYRYGVASRWGGASIELTDTGVPVTTLPGFPDPAAVTLVLTHPVAGYFYRRDGRLGTYTVWHEQIQLTLGAPQRLFFGIYERLGLLSTAEMQQPHSILISPSIVFQIQMPPRLL